MKKLLITGLCALFSLTAGAAQLELKKGDSVVLIGNTLAERMPAAIVLTTGARMYSCEAALAMMKRPMCR